MKIRSRLQEADKSWLDYRNNNIMFSWQLKRTMEGFYYQWVKTQRELEGSEDPYDQGYLEGAREFYSSAHRSLEFLLDKFENMYGDD